MFGRHLLTVVVASLVIAPAHAQIKSQPKEGKAEGKAMTVEQLNSKAKESVVVVLHTGRQGKQAGLGAGFVIDASGLIATNFHVIGEGRPISVLMPDGSKKDVVSVHASDRHLDLAIIKVDAEGLTPIPLGDSDKIKDGAPIAALGHPKGLKFSVVAGVLSGRREVEGVQMLQVAMPIEEGNSGGPVLDMFGRAVGVVTLKSLVAESLGFAVPVKDLKNLIDHPNPVPMSRWVTLGKLDPLEWQTKYGGSWRQRAGRITVDGTGTGFGGRALCFAKKEAPEKYPYEVAVTVKLDDEKGAAGLIFGGKGDDDHYGFYPSGGKLRFTRFNGPEVFSWKILHDAPSEAYRPGEWNTLKVKVEKDRAVCYVNDVEVLDQKGIDMFGGKAGLAKFRETVGEFKKFQMAGKIDGFSAPAKLITAMKDEIFAWKGDTPQPLSAKSIGEAPEDSMRLLRDRAKQLEKQAAQLRKSAQLVHHRIVLAEFEKLAKEKDADVDLLRGALNIARLDNEDLDVDRYIREVDRLSADISVSLPKDADDTKKLDAMNASLFKERGFHGSRHDYYSKNNSYLNEVIDDREGLPITLSVLYMEIARRLNLNVVGVALPGHFVVRHEPKGLPPYIIDVFEGGTSMTNQEAMEKIVRETGKLPKNKDFATAPKKAILTRMLHNLLNIAGGERDKEGMLRYLDAVITIEPKSHDERFARAVLRFQTGQRPEALEDCEYLIENASENDVNLDRVHELRQLLTK